MRSVAGAGEAGGAVRFFWGVVGGSMLCCCN